MRRALLAITGLAAGTTALVVLKGSPGVGQAAHEPPAVAAPSGGATPPAGTATLGAKPRARATTRTPSARATTARSTSAPRATTAAPRATTRRVTGPVVENEYGNVQVQIVVSGTRIVDAVALELPQETAQSDRRSEQVDGRYSGPSGQVVQRQSAEVDTVSGATATSESYRRSLQAAIDRAR
ncbi:FMN-binding protein [Micromonospora sp. WMMD712]|uniref:FMN-binding protein n=1 Tax=Micromonospora sp. WMMD712 TaxID=3016096 RepID=UPI00249A138A|nr:FMN-binding protein [Micromonospora sp. WMMD712]WFE57340.1 FMN-binding protein [Micromonospora sp. WMMD712]